MIIYLKKTTAPFYILILAIVLLSIVLPAAARADIQIYFIRHAEFDKKDPAKPLSKQGQLRAQSLVEYFKDRKLTHVYATHTDRTLDTATPLANQRKLVVEQVPEPGSIVNGAEVTNLSKGKIAIEAMISALRKLPDGSSVLVAANSGNIFAIMAGLGVPVSETCGIADESCLPCKNKSCFPGRSFTTCGM